MFLYIQKPLEEILKTDAFLEADTIELRVLLGLLSCEGIAREELAERVGLSTEDMLSALSYWRGAGFVKQKKTLKNTTSSATDNKEEQPNAKANQKASDKAKTGQKEEQDKQDKQKRKQENTREDNRENTQEKPSKAPGYSLEEIGKHIEKHRLSGFVDACQQCYQKEYGRTELAVLINLLEGYSLPPNYILMLLAWCMENDKRSMRYLETQAIALYNEGITTVALLEDYIEKLRKYRSNESKIRRIFGIGDRPLIKAEKERFARWLNLFGYGEDIIAEAYEKTVLSTGKSSTAYANKMLETWHLAGCRTLAEVKDFADKESAKRFAEKNKTVFKATEKTEKTEEKKGSFDTLDFFQKSLERSFKDKF